ncbi:phage tail tube protein [Geomicrobium sediminis]|uniref:Phage portal protein n=1 Tax=Geomicrobium sediminis TaxID=1347788 RepID=A0ABS2P6S4_9BACL|nr:phage tail tube protein [Geomicrobium sediminis]MBM7631100.1 hypothetical protein [Geomicrobium sediminis]
MTATYRGRNVINGAHGKLWWDGELIMEVKSFEAKVVANREEVPIGLDVDSKIVSLAGEGTMTQKKVYSRGMRKFLDAWRNGQDLRSTLTGVLADPDAIRSQTERVSISNVWFNEMTIMQWEEQAKLEREFPFGFTVSDVDIQDTIDA